MRGYELNRRHITRLHPRPSPRNDVGEVTCINNLHGKRLSKQTTTIAVIRWKTRLQHFDWFCTIVQHNHSQKSWSTLLQLQRLAKVVIFLNQTKLNITYTGKRLTTNTCKIQTANTFRLLPIVKQMNRTHRQATCLLSSIPDTVEALKPCHQRRYDPYGGDTERSRPWLRYGE